MDIFACLIRKSDSEGGVKSFEKLVKRFGLYTFWYYCDLYKFENRTIQQEMLLGALMFGAVDRHVGIWQYAMLKIGHYVADAISMEALGDDDLSDAEIYRIAEECDTMCHQIASIWYVKVFELLYGKDVWVMPKLN
jgi:hypothetical protein